MKVIVKRLFIAIVALFASAFIVVCIPLLNHWINDKGAKKGPRIVAQVEMKNLAAKPQENAKRQVKQPTRSKPMQTQIKAGPRFAMDLGVAGLGGALVSPDIINRKSGNGGVGGGSVSGDVDERPAATFPPPFRMPSEIKSAEKDAYLILSFCVDASGKPYDIQVSQEKPAGLGMAQAGREALRQTVFSPARKDGLAVAYCGLDQPFEVKFNN